MSTMSLVDGLELIREAVSQEYADHILSSLPLEITTTKSQEGSLFGDQPAGEQLHYFAPVPDFISMISEDVIPESFKALHWSSEQCDSSIVQRYHAGEGIKWHIDLLKFGDGVAILSLLSAITILFRKADAHDVRVAVRLPPKSLLLCSGEARYQWEHSIEAVESDWIDGREVARSDRISITMRRLQEA